MNGGRATIHRVLRRHCEERPEHEAAGEAGRRFTYAGLGREVDELARAYLAAGVRRGERVAFYGEPCIDYWLSFLAATSIGAIWLGLNPKYRLQELEYVIGDAEPMLVTVDEEIDGGDRREILAALGEGALKGRLAAGFDLPGSRPLTDFRAGGSRVSETELAAARAAVDPMDTALLVYTSGSSGAPKGAMLTHHGLTYGAASHVRHTPLREMRIVCNFPINHVACTGDVCMSALAAGGFILFQRQFDPAAVLRATAEERISIWGGVPTMLQLMLADPVFAETDLSSLEVVTWGGAAMPREGIEALMRLGVMLSCVYGMTETAANTTRTPPGASLEVLAETIGRAEPEFPCRVMAEEGREAQCGETGELQFRGDYLMKGYYKRPEATAEAFTGDGWMKTGDLVRLREDGYLEFTSRKSEMFKSGGYNVYPREIEIAIEQHPLVVMAAVVAMADPLYQEVGCAFVMPVPGGALDETELRNFLRARLANYKVPKRIEIRAMLPFLPVGKIDKMSLKKELAAERG